MLQDAGSFIIHNKTEDCYEDIVNNAEKWCDASTITENKPLPIDLKKS